jgi:DNA-binding transcriptional ArsR family regulator
MNVDDEIDVVVAQVAAAIGDVSRARMLYCLMDGHARTSTDLSVVADISPSTASVHLSRLTAANLIKVSVQGKHRYYSLAGRDVAKVLEGLSVLANGESKRKFVTRVPERLRGARVCYDHLAGVTGVALHDSFMENGWLKRARDNAYDVTVDGEGALTKLGIDLEATRALRRRFACPCPDWSERKPHLAGALGAAVLNCFLDRKWVVQDLDSRALSVTRRGQSELLSRFGIQT